MRGLSLSLVLALVALGCSRDPRPMGAAQGIQTERDAGMKPGDSPPDPPGESPGQPGGGDGQTLEGMPGETDGGQEATSDAGVPGTMSPPQPMTGECTADDEPPTCYSGKSGTAGVGACKAGTQACESGMWAACAGEVTDVEEAMCDNRDEDCDGKVDEGLSSGSCTPEGIDLEAPENACKRGRLVCDEGAMLCELIEDPQPEQCNGQDDDCDGEVDEDAQTDCYTGDTGCTQTDDGTYECEGICEAGTQRCVNGELVGQCMGQVGPFFLGEQCGASPAIDDDCDGEVDEGCTCTVDQECYDGPEDTLGVGECAAGKQACLFGVFQVCNEQVGPQRETCENEGEDNDCDGELDEVETGGACNTLLSGRCGRGTFQCSDGRTVCEPNAQPQDEECNFVDDDCDGRADEDFDLANNPNSCGFCGRQCFGSSGDCCGGNCVNLDDNRNHCGFCGRRCNSNEVCDDGECVCGSGLTECDGACVNTEVDNRNCGRCDNGCPSGFSCQDGVCDCNNGERLCSGVCIDVQTDEQHCGGCGDACDAGQICSGGSCACAPGPNVCGAQCDCSAEGDACCGDTCVDTRDDDDNCGECGKSCGSGGCVNSECLCNSGTYCPNLQDCVDLDVDDDDHCGSCTTVCGDGESCSGGECVPEASEEE